MGRTFVYRTENQNVKDANGINHDADGKFSTGGNSDDKSKSYREPSEKVKRWHDEYTRNIERKKIAERKKQVEHFDRVSGV